jgi:putative ABC transport system ATP-binding protein
MSIISLQGLKKTYKLGDNTVNALAGVTLDIKEGEFVAITGPSGSGKSTMMHILGCLDRPTEGKYLLNGKDVSSLPRD